MADPLAAGAPAPGEPTAAVRRRSLGVCLLLASAVLVGGLDLPASGYESFRFAPFGFTGGLLGILYAFALATRSVLWRPSGWPGAMLLVYWAAALAMLFRVLLPPPGLVQVGLAIMAAAAAGILVSRHDRESAVMTLGVVTVALSVVRFALVPLFWGRSELPNWGPLRMGASADAVRDFFVAYAPERPASQALHFLTLVLTVAALWLQWDPPGDSTSRAPDAAGGPQSTAG